MWSKQDEINFFKSALNGGFATVEDLFYSVNGKFLAYIPKEFKGNKNTTLQSRNSLIGNFTEIWCKKLLENIARKFNLFAVNSVICDEIGLIRSSRADLAFCTTNETIQKPQNIKAIFEIKMSIVNNYEFIDNEIKFIGDIKSHIALPSLTRSDSVLKAIGKSINIRVSAESSKSIPIIILGNSNLSSNYLSKIDHLGQSGVLQKIISLNSNIKTNANSPLNYFQTPKDLNELEKILHNILSQNLYYFSAMISKEKLARIIKISANKIEVAETFLNLIKDKNDKNF